MALSREESIAKYGTESYTAWDEPGALADATAKGLNVMQKQPNPAQLTSSGQNGSTQQPFQKIKGFTELQNKYAEQMYNQPDYAGMYQGYAKETGLTDVKGLITNIDNSVADIEDKIAKIEPNINKEIGDYLITEGQRGRMITAEEQPLRTQYSDILRSRSRLSAEASAKAELVNTLMNYAQTSYQGRLDYLKSLVDIEASNKAKASAGGNISSYLTPKTETKPTAPPTTNEQNVDALLKGITIDDSGSVQTPSSSSLRFDKSGNLILGGGIQLTPSQNNAKNLSSATKFSHSSSSLA